MAKDRPSRTAGSGLHARLIGESADRPRSAQQRRRGASAGPHGPRFPAAHYMAPGAFGFCQCPGLRAGGGGGGGGGGVRPRRAPCQSAQRRPRAPGPRRGIKDPAGEATPSRGVCTGAAARAGRPLTLAHQPWLRVAFCSSTASGMHQLATWARVPIRGVNFESNLKLGSCMSQMSQS